MIETSSSPEVRTAPKARVLLADNHPEILATAAQVLDDDYSVVGQVGDGKELVSAVDRLEPELVILDISMPQLDGLEAARRIRQRHPGIALVFLTVHEDSDYAQAALETGALGYVVKSRIASDLLPAVSAARSGRRFLSESVHL